MRVAPLKAKTSALPFVTTDGVPPTYVGHTKAGMLTPTRAPEPLTEAMARLVKSAEKHFFLKAAGDLFLSHDDRLLAQPRPVKP